MNEIIISAVLVAVVVLIIIVVQIITMRLRENHGVGIVIIPVGKNSENADIIDNAVRSVYHEESFYNYPGGREILIVDFGCRPELWEHYQKLSDRYKKVHAIKSYELYAYLKVKCG